MQNALEKALRRLQSLEFFWPFEHAIEDEHDEEEEDGDEESQKLSAYDDYFKGLIAYMEAYSGLHKTIDTLRIEGQKTESAASAACKKADRKFAEMNELSRTLVSRIATIIKFADYFLFREDFTQSYLFELKVDDAIHDAEYSIADLRSPNHSSVEPHVQLAMSYLDRARAARAERALSFAKEAREIAERKLAVLRRNSSKKPSTKLKAQTRAREALTQLSERAGVRFKMEEAKAEAHSDDLERVLKLNALLSFAMQDLRDEQDSVEAEVKFASHVLGEKHSNDVKRVRAAEDCTDSLTMKIGALDLNHNKAFFLLKQMLGAIESIKLELKIESKSESDDDSEYEDGGVLGTDSDESDDSGDAEVVAEKRVPVWAERPRPRTHLPDAKEALKQKTHEAMMAAMFWPNKR